MTRPEKLVPPSSDKREIRWAARSLRNSADSEYTAALSSEICKKLIALPEFERADIILAYSPLPSEIDTGELCRAARALGKAVVYPRCSEVDGEMDFFLVERDSDMRVGHYSICEPAESAPKICPENYSYPLCLLPALVCDREGYRIGYGKGYYDRYIQKHSMFLVGLCPDYLLIDSFEHDAHDIPAHIIVSEKEVLRLEHTTRTEKIQYSPEDSSAQ